MLIFSYMYDHFIWEFLFFSFIFISWRLITLQYCSGFCHTLTWISHGFTCVPHPDPPSHLGSFLLEVWICNSRFSNFVLTIWRDYSTAFWLLLRLRSLLPTLYDLSFPPWPLNCLLSGLGSLIVLFHYNIPRYVHVCYIAVVMSLWSYGL